MSMRLLIDAVVSLINTAIAGGTISAVTVTKGLQNEPQQLANTEYPYITVDEGGEFTELAPEPDSTRAQQRTYNVVIEIGTYSLENITAALDQCLDISDELQILLETNTKLSSGTYEFVWGQEITPFGWEDAGNFFRGRQIIVQYTELEDTNERY